MVINKNEILNNINKYSKEFSEGDDRLEKVLKKLWTNGFETIGCCKGHDEYEKQYIGLNRNDNEKIVRLLSLLNKEDISITFLFNHVAIIKNKNNDIFTNILDSIDKINCASTRDEEIAKVIDFIDNNNYDYTNIRFYYYKGKLNKYINTCDANLINILNKKYKCQKVIKNLNFNNNLPCYCFIIK